MIAKPGQKNTIGIIFRLYLLAVIAVSLYFFNQFYDLSITTLHAHDFLDCLFSGKAHQFYSIALEKSVNGGYFGNGPEMDAAFYNPLVYILISILILPAYIFIKIFRFSVESGIYNEYARLLLIAMSFWVAYILYKTVNLIKDKSVSYENIHMLFIGSPIFILTTIMSAQYDIFMVLLSSYAVYYYVQKKYWSFTIFTAIAACLKPFSLVYFFPMIILAHKDVIKIALKSIVVVLPYVMTNKIAGWIDIGYTQSLNLRDETYDFMGRLFAATIKGGIGEISLFILAYCIICVVVLLVDFEEKNKNTMGVILGIVSYIAFFTFVEYHTQWLVYVMPFVVLILALANDMREVMTLEIIASLLITIVTNMHGVLKTQLLYSVFTLANNSIDNQNAVDYCFYHKFFPEPTIPYTLMIGFLIAFAIGCVKDLKRDEKTISVKEYYTLMFIRASLILFYIVPSLYMFFTNI